MNTIMVDNDHFYSDHIYRKESMVGSHTFKNELDLDGKLCKRKKRRSFDDKCLRSNDSLYSDLFTEKDLYYDPNGPLKVYKLR